MEPTPPERDLTTWLAEHTDADAKRIEAELEVGERRRTFVVAELAEAGFEDAELLELVIRLTGIERRAAQALIAAQLELSEPRQESVPKRDRALAENEIFFRQVNERLASADADAGTPAPHDLALLCECSDRDCLKVLRIAAAEYEWLRQDPRRFAVLPGHEAPALEDVVERHDGFVIVEKHVETHEQVEAADPRA